MIKIQFKTENGVSILSIDPSFKTIENDIQLMDYVAERLQNMQINYTWFKIIT